MTNLKDDIFIDTNILLRYQIRNFPECPLVKQAVDKLFQEGHRIWISRQVLREFSGVCTRPQKFMNPISSAVIAQRIEAFMPMFDIADETSATSQAFLWLMKQFPIGGKQVHDANIVATMQVYRIPKLFTLNIADFKRFGSLIQLIEMDSTGNLTL